ELESDIAIQALVMGAENHTHAPSAKLLDNAVMAECLADELMRRGHRVKMLGRWPGKVNGARAGRGQFGCSAGWFRKIALRRHCCRRRTAGRRAISGARAGRHLAGDGPFR